MIDPSDNTACAVITSLAMPPAFAAHNHAPVEEIFATNASEFPSLVRVVEPKRTES